MPRPKSATAGSASSVVGVIAVGLLASLIMTQPAHADTPSDAILKQLEQRLLEPPPCVPRCAEIIDANVVIERNEMTIRLTVNALEKVALSLASAA